MTRVALRLTSALLLTAIATAKATANIADHFSSLNEETPGCAVGVVRGHELVYEGYFGQANLRYNVPISEKTVFDIGSISKHFTAAIAHKLAKNQTLSLNDSLKKYYPDGPKWFNDVKLHHLINHQSGLPDYPTDKVTFEKLLKRLAQDTELVEDLIFGWPIENKTLIKHVIALMLEQPAPAFGTDEKAKYSNTGYLLLADIMEKSSGQPFNDLLRTQIINPFKMDNTSPASDATIEIPWSATGYGTTEIENLPYRRRSGNVLLQGDGGMLTTLRDLAKWVSHLLSPKTEAEFWHRFLLPPVNYDSKSTSLDLIASSNFLPSANYFNPNQSPAELPNGPYNNGLIFQELDGGPAYSHAGLSAEGMASLFWFSPKHQVGYIQLCNFNYASTPSKQEILKDYAHTQ